MEVAELHVKDSNLQVNYLRGSFRRVGAKNQLRDIGGAPLYRRASPGDPDGQSDPLNTYLPHL